MHGGKGRVDKKVHKIMAAGMAAVTESLYNFGVAAGSFLSHFHGGVTESLYNLAMAATFLGKE